MWTEIEKQLTHTNQKFRSAKRSTLIASWEKKHTIGHWKIFQKVYEKLKNFFIIVQASYQSKMIGNSSLLLMKKLFLIEFKRHSIG